MFNTWKKILEGGDPATLAHPVDRYNVCDKKPQGAAPKADDPLHVLQALQSVGKSKYGSLSGEIEALRARKLRKLDAGIAKRLFIDEKGCSEEKQSASDQSVCQPVYAKSNHQAHFHVETDVKGVPESIIIVESDGEDGEAHRFSDADDVHLDAGTKGVSKSIITINMEEADPVTRMPSESNLQTNASVKGPDRERSTNELMVGNCSEGEPVKEAVGTPNTLDKGKDKCWGSRFSIQLMVEGKCPTEDLANSSGETGTSRNTNFKNIIDHVHLSALEDTLTPKETINCVDEVAAEMELVAHDSLEREVSGREVGSSPSSKVDTIECLYNGTDDNLGIEEDNYPIDEEDDLSNIWMEMAFSMECSKDVAMDASFMKEKNEHDEGDCDHSFVLKEDIGHVCRICGLVQRSIETIFEFNYSKGRRTTRTYASAYQKTDKREQNVISPDGVSYLEDNSMTNQIVAHPRHHKQMRTHQLEGFNFLCSNLLADEPGGCILAHAPGSGKTFMIISFIQGFLAKYPRGRPLVVLPKGILATWKKEFQAWQVEDIPLLDFYSSKAENRHQQLDVLKQWINQKSILFLGYNQFSKIVCDVSSNKVTADCQDILLTKPTILILDEGHTPRNEDTDVLTSLSRVQTPRKVALSGTLYQNHVEEVFNILNLVRPKFLEFKTSKAAVNRIMSRVDMTGAKRQSKPGTSSAFFEAVEHTLQRDENFQRKMAVVQDLREMTSKVLHFYKGDFLDELPGLVDFTVLLNLTAVQKVEAQKLMKLDRFKRIAAGGAVYMHPELKYFAEKYPGTGDKSSAFDNEKIDAMLQNLIVEHGVKLKFFINILGLCESAGEKLLVFSQYILPLKLLERICVKQKGWSPGKEMFMITGDTNTEQRDWSMEQFNGSPNAKVFFGSIKACGEGISLVGASRILILDVHLNPSVSRQAIGRAFRPGQKRKVYAYRLVAADSQEEADNLTCFRKELISKLWFEWDGSCSNKDLDGMSIEVDECGDMFFESPVLREDVKAIYKRR